MLGASRAPFPGTALPTRTAKTGPKAGLSHPEKHARPRPRRRPVNGDHHPKGALAFMLVYLLVLALLWVDAYLQLWKG